jgi:hypothetical protein
MAFSSKIIALTIDVNYLPDWGVREGLRELVQNWLDAADDIGQEGTVGYNSATKVLSLHNPGGDMSESALLIGKTSKLNRDDQRGQFGEGLKFGSLALAREERTVVVRTRNKIWRAKIQESPDFAGEKVLTWHVMDSSPHNGVSVTISPVEHVEYQHIRNTFTHFIDVGDAIETKVGRILLSPLMEGQVYVKGILVMESEDLKFGYDFSNIQVDRDRRMIRQTNLESATANAWWYANASGHEKASAENILQMITDDYPDLKNARWWNQSTKRQIAQAFLAKYPDTVPVMNDGEVAALAHYGSTGRNVGQSLFNFLHGVEGIQDAEVVKWNLGRAPKKTYGYSELSEDKMQNFLWAAGELEAVLDNVDVLARVKIVDFHDPNLHGLHRGHGVEISSRMLVDKVETLQVLLHEFAHDYGIDGSKAHIHMIESLWKKLATNWVS